MSTVFFEGKNGNGNERRYSGGGNAFPDFKGNERPYFAHLFMKTAKMERIRALSSVSVRTPPILPEIRSPSSVRARTCLPCGCAFRADVPSVRTCQRAGVPAHGPAPTLRPAPSSSRPSSGSRARDALRHAASQAMCRRKSELLSKTFIQTFAFWLTSHVPHC